MGREHNERRQTVYAAGGIGPMAHWRTMVGERTHFDVADLNGQDLTIQIEACREGVVKGMVSGKLQETRAVLVKYVGVDRLHAYKATLCKSMVSLYGTGDVAKWPGKWVTLHAAMVNDPQIRGAKCEAIRIRPAVPSEQQIAAAKGGKSSGPNETDDRIAQLVGLVCNAIETAPDEDAIEAVIAPHRDVIRAADKRSQTIVLSAKRARLATLQSPPTAPGGDTQ